ncbi:MAG TPA: hypothetical protein VFZ65_04005 [Planctomycetota bacterium]|nr:hypothetical protein [Planctomycetota bacterium]
MSLPRFAGALCATLATAVPAWAQFPYGTGAPGTGGIVPTIACNQPWAGRTDFAVRVDHALGGSIGLVLFGTGSSNTSALGLPVYVDLATIALSEIVLLGGTPGAGGAGSGQVPLSLASISPAFIGFELFAQAVLFDPAGPGLGGGWTATSGLAWQITHEPQLFVACSVGGSSDPRWGAGAVPGTIEFSGGDQYSDNVDGAAYSNDGRDLYVSSGFGQLAHADVSTNPPAWSWLNTSIGSTGVAWDNVVLDRERKLVWMMGQPSGSVELLAVDIDQGSATYGQIVHNTTTLSLTVGLIGVFHMSHDKKLAAVPGLLSPTLHLVDTDSTSATFLQVVASSPIPPSTLGSPLTLNVRIRFSPDDSECYVLMQNAGPIPAEIARYLVGANLWLDHDPATPAIDHIGPNASPPVPFGSAPLGFDVGKDGALYVCGWGGAGFAGRVVLAGVAPIWTPLNASSSLQNARHIALNRDETVLAVAVANPTTTILFFDAATLTEFGATSLGASVDSTVLVWR